MKALITIVALLPMLVMAQVQSVPQTIGYQGRLLKADGTPLNSKVSVTFRIYAQATGDTTLSLWSEQQDITPNSGGFYAVFLGSVNSFGGSVFNGENRWLGITIGSDAELIPRQKIGSVAYALRAGHAESASNVTGGNVNTGAISAVSLNLSGKGYSATTTAGDPANTMTTKGYVDAVPNDVAQEKIDSRELVLGDKLQWSRYSLIQLPNKLTVAHFWLSGGGANIVRGQPILTMPAGYAPQAPFEFAISTTTCGATGAFHGTLSTNGVVTTNDAVVGGGCNYVFQLVYVAR